MIRSHRMALDPTLEQRIALGKACGVARFTWNWALATWNTKYESGEKVNANALKKEWNSLKHGQFPWVGESPKDVNQRPFANLNTAFQRFFKKTSKRPVFKKKGQHDSFYVCNDTFTIVDSAVKLPVIGKVKMFEKLRFDGKIMSGTVSRTADRWFLSVAVETAITQLKPVNKHIGIDLGLTTTVVCSDGQKFNAPKPLKAHLKRLKLKSKQLSRKQKGSQNRKKAQQGLAKLHNKISNIRSDWTHKLTTQIVRENQTICLEDLSVKGMMANKKLSRAISDVSWFEIRRQLEYKAGWYGREVRIVGRFVPTSKTCSNCGHKKGSLALSERVFKCTQCGIEIDRDLNAAINIRTVGLTGSYACGLEGHGSALKSSTKPFQGEAGIKPGVH